MFALGYRDIADVLDFVHMTHCNVSSPRVKGVPSIVLTVCLHAGQTKSPFGLSSVSVSAEVVSVAGVSVSGVSVVTVVSSGAAVSFAVCKLSFAVASGTVGSACVFFFDMVSFSKKGLKVKGYR